MDVPTTQVPPPVGGGKHLPGTDGAADVVTRYVTQGLAAIRDIIVLGAFGAFTGPPGLSKTFVAKTGCELANVRYRYFETPDKPVGKQLEIALTLAFMGSVDRRMTRAELQEGLREWLKKPGLAVLDEAHRLGLEGVETVRYLASGPENKTAILFVGHDLGPLLKRHKALESRIARPLAFKPLSAKEMLVAVKDYHPFFGGAKEDLLETVQTEYGKGNFRRWAMLFEAGSKIASQLGVEVLTPKVYRLARAKLVSLG